MDQQAVQVMREIDKLDKIGLDGVCAMLGDGLKDTSGAFNKGVGLDPLRIGMIRLFFEESAAHEGSTNDQRLEQLEKAMGRVSQVRNRIDMMIALEEHIYADGSTAWDRLLSMPACDRDTWENGKRPKNVAWALDDIVKVIRAQRGKLLPSTP